MDFRIWSFEYGFFWQFLGGSNWSVNRRSNSNWDFFFAFLLSILSLSEIVGVGILGLDLILIRDLG
jgi:hypothetical protein